MTPPIGSSRAGIRGLPLEASVVAKSNLTVWYKFEEGSGTTALDSADSSEFGNSTSEDGTLNGPTYTTSSQVGTYALDFDGVDDEVNTPISSLSTPFSVTAWVNIEDKSSSGEFFGNFASTDGDFWFGYSEGPDVFRFSPEASGVTTATNPSTGVWYHLAAVLTSSDYIIYLNGSQDGSDTGSSVVFDSGVDYSIGHIGDNTIFWDGLLDDIRIYDDALSASQVQEIYNNTS